MLIQGGPIWAVAGRSNYWRGARLDYLNLFKSGMRAKDRWYADITGVTLQLADVNREIREVGEVILAKNSQLADRSLTAEGLSSYSG